MYSIHIYMVGGFHPIYQRVWQPIIQSNIQGTGFRLRLRVGIWRTGIVFVFRIIAVRRMARMASAVGVLARWKQRLVNVEGYDGWRWLKVTWLGWLGWIGWR